MPLQSALLPILAAATPLAPCGAQQIAVGEQLIWVDQQGTGATTVVFEAGNGADSTVWDALEPRVRALGVRTFRYDRAGYGKSAPRADAGYRVESDLDTLRRALDYCQVRGPVIEVAHSYGGSLALLGRARFERGVAGLVLVDAQVPGAETRQSVAATLDELRPQYAEVRKQAPALARTLIPVVEAFPRTISQLNRLNVDPALPIVDIVADGGEKDKPRRMAEWRAAHRRFVEQSPQSRRYVDAAGSGHQVMKDRPDLILDAIAELLRRIGN